MSLPIFITTQRIMLSFVLKNEEIQEKNLLAYVKKSIIPAVSDTYEDLQAE